MVFSSSIFLFAFLPILFSAYLIIDRKFKNVLLLLASIFFYSWGAPLFIFVILGTTTLDFFLVRKMYFTTKESKRKLFLILSLFLNVGLLFYFKYSNFFIENINFFLGSLGMTEISWTKLVLPIGISFYTFETLTYVIDVYRRIHPPLTKFWDYQLYIILFPKLIAGPIIRYHQISDQISDREVNETTDNRINGFFRFVIGLSKKILIANVLGEFADNAYAMDVQQLNSSTAWMMSICYSFQIYFDFSGYSDMAIGLALMFGFKFPENFSNPYIATSITDFWRRWHISLGTWMRNYLYIPLGGNRVDSTSRLYFNLWIVFLLSGLWHGASWTFIVWGAYHGLFLILERIFLLKVYDKIGRIPSILLTFLLVNIGWVFFKSESLSAAFYIVSKLFSFDFGSLALHMDNRMEIVLILGFFFSFIWVFKFIEKWQYHFIESTSTTSILSKVIVSILFFVLCSAYIVASDFNPFIYFRF